MHRNIAIRVEKNFYSKKLSTAGMRIRLGYPNPLETGMRFDFSSRLDLSKITGKYMRVEYGDMEGITHHIPPHCHA